MSYAMQFTTISYIMHSLDAQAHCSG